MDRAIREAIMAEYRVQREQNAAEEERRREELRERAPQVWALVTDRQAMIGRFCRQALADASFETLRADGAFLVSARQSGGTVEVVRVFSEKGSLLRMVNPFAVALVTRGDGSQQEVRGEICVLTQAGETLTVEKKA